MATKTYITKFDIGDTVYIAKNNEVFKSEVVSLNLEDNNINTIEKYLVILQYNENEYGMLKTWLDAKYVYASESEVEFEYNW